MSSKQIYWPHVLTVGGAGILVATEVIALTWAAGWALGGLIGLPWLFATFLELLGVGIGLTASFYFIRAALRVEPIIGADDPSVASPSETDATQIDEATLERSQ